MTAILGLVPAFISSAAGMDPFARDLLGTTDARIQLLSDGAKRGLIEIAPVNLPVDPPGDCNHYGWPVATMAGGAIIVMHRRIPGHRKTGSGRPHPRMSYGIVLRSEDAGKSWSDPYDLRDCMKPEDRLRGGIVPLSHRFKFDEGNKSRLGYKIHLHSIGTLRDDGVIAVNNHGVFRSDDAGRTWRHFSTALREDTFPHELVNIGPRVMDHPQLGITVFGNYFGNVGGSKWHEKLIVMTSKNGGGAWTANDFETGIRQYEPAALLLDGAFKLITRNQTSGRDHQQLDWQPGAAPRRTPTNLKNQRYVDTVDFSFNPVTKRFEVVRSERYRMQLWLWSMEPKDWNSGKWRRECRLFARDGRFYREADGFHPAGAVIDEKRGMQHIFIYTGHPNGPAGVFRISRTLNTPRLVKFLRQ